MTVTKIKLYYYTWSMFEKDIHKLANLIRKYDPKIPYIAGVPRGGLIVAIKLSHILKKKFISTTDAKFKTIKAVVVDDITDYGITLREFVYNNYSLYTLHEKKRSLVKTNHVKLIDNNIWIVYPWEDKKLALQDYRNYVRRRK